MFTNFFRERSNQVAGGIIITCAGSVLSPGVESPGFATAAVFISVVFAAAVALIFAAAVITGNTHPLARVSDRVQINHRTPLKLHVHPVPVGTLVRVIESGKLASDTVVTPVTLTGPVFVTRNV